MRTLTPDELRFSLHFGLQQLPKSILRDLQTGGPKREVALKLATDAMVARFEGHEVLAPGPGMEI